MGVITSFAVAKKISEEELTKFFAKGKKEGKTVAQLNDIIRDKVVGEIEQAVVTRKIPGLLSTEELAKEMGIKKNIIADMPELNRLIMVIGHKLVEKKYGKMSLCYFINSLVNILGLSENDFEQFHRQNNSPENPEDDDDEDDDGEEFRNG